MIRFTCECGKLLQAREEQAGLVATCPGCGRQQTIPQHSTAVQPGAPERGPAPATGVRQGPGHDGGGPHEGQPAGPPVQSGKANAALVLGLLSFCALILTGLPAAILGFLALGDIKKGRGRVTGQGFAIVGIVLGLLNSLATCGLVPLALLFPAVSKVREAAARVQSQNNLKIIALAMHNYHATYGRLPPAALTAPNNPNRPLLSWRVAILPFIEQDQLYKQFNLNEPWDGPTNRRLLALMPKTYLVPTQTPSPDGLTLYQAFVGPGTAFENKPQGIRFGRDFPDGTSNTFLVVEAANGVPWTKPDDLPFNPNGPLPPLGGSFRKGFNAAFADGSVRFIPDDTPAATLKGWITRNGGEMIAPPP